jgi:hypothetical protein
VRRKGWCITQIAYFCVGWHSEVCGARVSEVSNIAPTEFVITIEPHAEPAMLEEIAGSLVHDLIRVNVFDSCCRSDGIGTTSVM